MEGYKIDNILCNTLISTTEYITNITFKRMETVPTLEEEYLVLSTTMKGTLSGLVRFYFPRDFIEKLMELEKQKAPEVDKEEVFVEMVNIIFGRMISCVNNYLGSSTRFTPPVLVNDKEEPWFAAAYWYDKQFFFESSFGIIQLRVAYTIK